MCVLVLKGQKSLELLTALETLSYASISSTRNNISLKSIWARNLLGAFRYTGWFFYKEITLSDELAWNSSVLIAPSSYFCCRCEDLQCIYSQLKTRSILTMVELLDRVQSTYFPAFTSMFRDVEAGEGLKAHVSFGVSYYSFLMHFYR